MGKQQEQFVEMKSSYARLVTRSYGEERIELFEDDEDDFSAPRRLVGRTAVVRWFAKLRRELPYPRVYFVVAADKEMALERLLRSIGLRYARAVTRQMSLLEAA